MRARWLALAWLLLVIPVAAQRAEAQPVESEEKSRKVAELLERARRMVPQPDARRVSEAASTPETLWAFLIDPSTSYDDRMGAAEKAKTLLPARYLPVLIAAQKELQWESFHHLWWQGSPASGSPAAAARTTILGFEWQPPAEPVERPKDLASLRRMPWPWQVQQALRWELDPGDAKAMDIVRDLPCRTALEQDVIASAVTHFIMTAETYGVLRNLLARNEGLYPTYGRWFGDISYTPEDEQHWWATQAFLAERVTDLDSLHTLSRAAGTMRTQDGPGAPRAKVRRSERVRGPVPYTLFLAVAKGIEQHAVRSENHCRLASYASHLVQALDAPPFEAEPRLEDEQQCFTWMANFQRWLDSRREELEAKAAAERAAIAAARVRMEEVTLCR